MCAGNSSRRIEVRLRLRGEADQVVWLLKTPDAVKILELWNDPAPIRGGGRSQATALRRGFGIILQRIQETQAGIALQRNSLIESGAGNYDSLLPIKNSLFH